MEEEPFLERIQYTFSQEGNTLGTTNEYEEITITVESTCGSIDKEGGFFVIKTDGWSVNSISDLKDLFNRVKHININE